MNTIDAMHQENRFTGWTDVPLSETGHKEAIEAGKLLALLSSWGFGEVDGLALGVRIRPARAPPPASGQVSQGIVRRC